MNKLLVSICIPTLNGSEFIEEALNSAINQTYCNLEIIVSDDSSIDNTVSVVESYKKKTNTPIFIYHHKPQGIGANWNQCIKAAKDYFNSVDNKFTIGVGNPLLRHKMYLQFTKLGGTFTSTISPLVQIDHYNVSITKGCNILHQAILSNDVTIGKGCIIYFDSIITYDVKIGDFVEVSPHVSLLGRCSIGEFTQIGSHDTVQPDLKIARKVIIAAGAVVTKNVPDYSLVAGVPAILKKKLNPLDF